MRRSMNMPARHQNAAGWKRLVGVNFSLMVFMFFFEKAQFRASASGIVLLFFLRRNNRLLGENIPHASCRGFAEEELHNSIFKTVEAYDRDAPSVFEMVDCFLECLGKSLEFVVHRYTKRLKCFCSRMDLASSSDRSFDKRRQFT